MQRVITIYQSLLHSHPTGRSLTPAQLVRCTATTNNPNEVDSVYGPNVQKGKSDWQGFMLDKKPSGQKTERHRHSERNTTTRSNSIKKAAIETSNTDYCSRQRNSPDDECPSDQSSG